MAMINSDDLFQKLYQTMEKHKEVRLLEFIIILYYMYMYMHSSHVMYMCTCTH